METIKVNFGYFWPAFKKEDNYFTRILSKKYKVEISENPQLYFFTHPYNGKRDYFKYKCHRVFLGLENMRANWNICDYVLDSDFYNGNPHHKRWPIWALWNVKKLTEPKEAAKFADKKKFCCMVVSNAKAKERIDFFHKLSKYKKIDSGGKFLNNVGGHVADKMEFIKDYKFVISFENSSYPGYTTEKIIEPMLSNTIPVYWGNPVVGKDFNTKSFVNVGDFDSFQHAIDHIIELDNDDKKFIAMAKETWFNNNTVPFEFSENSLAEFMDFIIQDCKTKKPVAKSFFKKHKHRTALASEKIKTAVFNSLKIDRGFR